MHEVSECGGKKRKTGCVRSWSSQALTAKAVNSNKSRLLLLLVTVLLGHADNDITISQVDAAAGETATVTVSLSNATPLAGFTVVIDYDLNRVVPVAYRAAGRASTHPLPDGDDGQLLTLVIDSPIPAGSGPIINIDFRVRDDEPPGIIPIGNGHIRVPPTGPPSLTLSLSLTDALEADPPVIGTVTLHNVALINMDEDANSGFEKLQFLLQQNPCPPETFGNLLLLYCKYEHYDLAADVMAENFDLTYKLLSQYVYDYLDATITQQTSPEEGFRKFDAMSNAHTEQLRKLTKQVQQARLRGRSRCTCQDQ